MLADLRSVADLPENLNAHPGRGRSAREGAIGHATSEDAVIISSDSDIEIGQFAHTNYRCHTHCRLITTIIQLGLIKKLPLNLAC